LTVYTVTVRRVNEVKDEAEHIKTLVLSEQEGPLATGTKFYEMRDEGSLDELVVQDPGESVYALASSALSKYDAVERCKKEG
jgi:hypothetical protein